MDSRLYPGLSTGDVARAAPGADPASHPSQLCPEWASGCGPACRSGSTGEGSAEGSDGRPMPRRRSREQGFGSRSGRWRPGKGKRYVQTGGTWGCCAHVWGIPSAGRLRVIHRATEPWRVRRGSCTFRGTTCVTWRETCGWTSERIGWMYAPCVRGSGPGSTAGAQWLRSGSGPGWRGSCPQIGGISQRKKGMRFTHLLMCQVIPKTPFSRPAFRNYGPAWKRSALHKVAQVGARRIFYPRLQAVPETGPQAALPLGIQHGVQPAQLL